MQTSPRWPIGTTGALWLAFLLIVGHYLSWIPSGILTILFGFTDRREIWQASPAAFAVILSTGVVEIGLVLRLGMCRFARLSFRDAGWHGFALRDVGYGVLGFALSAISLTCVLAYDNGFADSLAYIVDKVAHYTPQQHVFFVVMALIAVIPEETIFRGILQPTLQTKLGEWSGVVLTALIFSAYHLQFLAPVQLVSHAVHGLILGLLRKRTGTVWAPAIAHALLWIILGAI
jgi:membrane protease YdiL (CAAX protease family)